MGSRAETAFSPHGPHYLGTSHYFSGHVPCCSRKLGHGSAQAVVASCLSVLFVVLFCFYFVFLFTQTNSMKGRCEVCALANLSLNSAPVALASTRTHKLCHQCQQFCPACMAAGGLGRGEGARHSRRPLRWGRVRGHCVAGEIHFWSWVETPLFAQCADTRHD